MSLGSGFFFIDVYYNMDGDRLDFTTIRGDQRIFGYDNAGGWHYHPVEAPDRHEPCAEPTLEEMFEQTARVIEKVAQGESQARYVSKLGRERAAGGIGEV